MKQFYHVTIASLWDGDTIEPGRHGKNFRQFRPGGPMPTPEGIASIMWEVALESARVATDPLKPSRLNCVFAFETLACARRFKAKHRTDGSILKIGVANGIGCHRGDFDIISAGTSAAYVDYMSDGANRYWTAEPTGFVEVLIGGPVRVIEIVE